MKKERIKARLADLVLNSGQLVWLPANPRQWRQEDINKTKKSLQTDPDFLEEHPLLVVRHGKKLVVFAGNLRTTAAKELKWETIEAVLYTPETEEDKTTILRRSLLDNGQFGSWDYDALANEWHEFQLTDFGIPAWDAEREMERDTKKQMENGGLSSQGMESGEGYDEFLDKFKQKLTTDDCYTPAPVYDAVLDFVGTITPTKGRKIIRPFFPGGDYEDATQYPKGCLVVDNPPFSILSKIIRFYCNNGIKFFLFAPALTLFSAADCDVTYIVSDSDIEYENGARVRTGFITNLIPELRIWCCPELASKIEAAQDTEDKTKTGFVYPDNIVTAAILMKLTRRDVELKITKKACEYIKDSDSAKVQGRALFGGGFIMSDRAAAERAAAERAAAGRTAAERTAATRLNLSKREKSIIARLNEQDKE